MSELTCERCGTVDQPILYWLGIHLGAKCRACYRWIKWIPQTDEWLDAAPSREEQPVLLL